MRHLTKCVHLGKATAGCTSSKVVDNKTPVQLHPWNPQIPELSHRRQTAFYSEHGVTENRT